MGIIEQILAGGVGTAFTAAGNLLKDLREAITGKAIVDPMKLAELAQRAQETENGLILAQMAYEKAQMEGQLAVNKAEAESSSLFKGGWRPAVGWVCVLGLGYEFLLRPLLPWCIQVGAAMTGLEPLKAPLPEIPMGDLLTLLFGILGIGGMRMYEKVKGVSSK